MASQPDRAENLYAIPFLPVLIAKIDELDLCNLAFLRNPRPKEWSSLLVTYCRKLKHEFINGDSPIALLERAN